ncbi:ABC transporter substrate-binding protein [Lolliginicoccus suaedae]|uniref:ABC transporter substrate-binding protein n=1 Tax=Lolliginicoccus suaedae TaxID=2605429 RepID=UPI0011EC7A82|nr:ABC transporter substrate-binding protein [Lolliginicoccus suaedae]
MLIPSRRLAAAPLAALALVAASCGSSAPEPEEEFAQTPQGSLRLPREDAGGIPARCGPGGGRTVAAEALTIAVDDPAFPPWIIDNDPASGQGFEAAIARAVADTLGYSPAATEFVRVPFDEALEPGPKTFDFAINQFSIMGERRENVDFSEPYYAVAQAVVAIEGTPAADASTLDDLQDLTIGADAGSTSMYSATHSIEPDTKPVGYPSVADAATALAAGEIETLVADLPTAVRIANDQLADGVVVGRFPAPNEVTEFLGLVLEKDSDFTECASLALRKLHHAGELEELAHVWLTDHEDVPVLGK